MTDNDELERAIQEQITDHLQIAAAEMEQARRLAGQENPVSGDMTSIRTWILGLIDSQEPDRNVDLQIYTQEYDGGRHLVHILQEEGVDEDDMNFLNTLEDMMDDVEDESEDGQGGNIPDDVECEKCIINYDNEEEHDTFLA